MIVRELMTEKVAALRPNEPLARAAELMDTYGVRHAPVTDDDGELVGLVSQRDLLRHSLRGQTDLTLNMQEEILDRARVGDVMVDEPEHIEPDADVRVAAELMLDNKYGCLPVTEGARLVGIVTESDFVRAFLRTV